MVADWRPAAPLEQLRRRAALLRRVRAFFEARGLLEVETPALSGAATTDPQIESLVARPAPGGADAAAARYLHTSPEFPMKRLLAAGSGPIWQIARVFRDGERGRRHNPEFTLLEWYRPGWSSRALIDEVAALVADVVEPRALVLRTYADCLAPLGVDAHRDGAPALVAAAEAQGIVPPAGLGRAALLDLLMGHCVAPGLGSGCIDCVTDFPVEHAALAWVRPGEPPVAERFECYLEGMEIANGFRELTDPEEQRRRFHADQAQRRAAGAPVPPADERLLAALEAGLPECAGVAVGLDRLFMVALGATDLDGVVAFPVERA